MLRGTILGDYLRVVMVWAGTRDTQALRLAARWATLLSDGSTPPTVCIWSTKSTTTPSCLDEVDLCWHHLRLPTRVDRHVHHAHPRLPWSPWGVKSGPNFQFFRVLDEFAAAHPHDWVLYAEPDTFPMGTDPALPVTQLLERHVAAWMIGGLPHPKTRKQLDVSMWRHLNGAALYKVGDSRFAEFRATTWIPSLLWKIRGFPEYAYDCITDPQQHVELPVRLAGSWAREASRFVPTAGIVNLSTQTLTQTDVAGLADDRWLQNRCADEETTPWLLHAKGVEVTTSLLPRTIS